MPNPRRRKQKRLARQAAWSARQGETAPPAPVAEEVPAPEPTLAPEPTPAPVAPKTRRVLRKKSK